MSRLRFAAPRPRPASASTAPDRPAPRHCRRCKKEPSATVTVLERRVTKADGQCRIEGNLLAEDALRGAWRMRCARGDLRVAVTLAPDPEARVQHLDVRPMGRDESLAPPPTCR